MKQIVIYCADVEAYRAAGMTFPLYIVSPWFSVILESEEAQAVVPYHEDSLRMIESSLPKGIGYRVEELNGGQAETQTESDIEYKQVPAEAQYEASANGGEPAQAEPQSEGQTQSKRRRRGVGGE